VPVATAEFDAVLGERVNQVGRRRDDVEVSGADLLDVAATPGEITDEGVANNVTVGISYIDSWLAGNGAAAINNLMEDAATAEIGAASLGSVRSRGTMAAATAAASTSADTGPWSQSQLGCRPQMLNGDERDSCQPTVESQNSRTPPSGR